MLRSPLLRPRLALRVLATALAVTAVEATAPAQMSFTSRNGTNFASCGLFGSGLSATHSFSAPSPTADTISFSDPGSVGSPPWPPSAASSSLEATPAPFGISMTHAGSGSRGALGPTSFAPASTADARDHWYFTLAAPARFTFSVSLSASSSPAPAMAPQSYFFVGFGAGGQVIPDPGTPPNAFSASLTVPGSLAVTASGTLTAGDYVINLQSRVDGRNAWPYDGSFANSIALVLECGTASPYCTAGTSAGGCSALLSAAGSASPSTGSGFVVTANGVEGLKDGLFFFAQNGRQANPWGNGTSYQCVVPPVRRAGLLAGTGTAGACDGVLSQDLNAQWCPTCPKPAQAPVPGLPLQVQLWYRDPASTSNQSTSLSDALEVIPCP